MQAFLPKLLRPLLVLLLLLPAGCAKSPSGGASSPVSGPQLLVTMTVAGTINPNYYYYILFNVNRTPGPGGTGVLGPVPVVAAPYGNGFAAGAFTNYVEYHTNLSSTNFYYYGITANLLQPVPLGQGQIIQAQTSSNTLTFQLPLAYLATSTVTAATINSLEINFVATNIIPVVTDNISTGKYFDALSPTQGSYSYVDLIIRDSNNTLMPGIYSSSTSGVNGGPVAQSVNGTYVPFTGTLPDGGSSDSLAITNWTIQLTAGS